MSEMRIAIMGAGGIGAYYGACLARAGADVVFIARGAHLDAMRNNGLRVQEFGGADFTVDSVNATDDPAEIGPVDAVLFCVKMYDTIHAAELCKPLMGNNTMVVTLQNGVESVDMINSVLGAEPSTGPAPGLGQALGGAAYISATIVEPGVVKRNNQMAKIEFGEPDGTISRRATAFAKTLKDAGIETAVTPAMQTMLWSKFVLLTANSGMTSLSGEDTGVVRADPVMRAVYRDAMRESVAVGRAMDVYLPDDIIERSMDWLDSSAPIKASLAVDLERGRRLEVEWLSGAVHRLGAQVGVPTPIHSTVYAALRPHVNGKA
ncbi:MAG: 2-dehydropantoate 2-reductase [Rhodospirillaceae bacterium]|nr:2-dehydropantoate 2-reductase [Rhodospirillaceae bacterium]MBT5665495.1 2-dehydropantoate 2-reductase [Rhodospirillaceae bacterium]